MAPSLEHEHTGSAGAAGGPWAPSAGPDGGSPWTPAMPIWRFWLLMFLTMGLYRLFWVVGVARELRRHQDPGIRPWLYFIGMLFGITAPIVAWALTGHIDRNGHRRGLEPDPTQQVIVTLAIVAMLVQFGILHYHRGAEMWQLAVALLGFYTVIEPAPWALIQFRLNRLKSAMAFPEKPVRPFQFSGEQFGAAIVAMIIWPLFAIGTLPDPVLEEIFAEAPLGEAVQPNTPTTGISGGYRLEVRSDDWVRVDGGTIAEEADLELVRQSPGTSIIVYALGGGWTLDEIVDFRRNEIKQEVHRLTSDERRTLLSDTGIPISHAQYTGLLQGGGGMRGTWWVSTVVTDSTAIEVLGTTTAGRATQEEIEQIVRSLRLERP